MRAPLCYWWRWRDCDRLQCNSCQFFAFAGKAHGHWTASVRCTHLPASRIGCPMQLTFMWLAAVSQNIAVCGPNHADQGSIRMAVHHKRREGYPPPPPWTPAPPPKIKVTVAGKTEIYKRENLVRPFLVHNLLGPRPRSLLS